MRSEGIILSCFLFIFLRFYTGSILVWRSVFLGAGRAFYISLSTINNQIRRFVAISEKFLIGGVRGAIVVLTLWIFCVRFFVSDKVNRKGNCEGYYGLLRLLNFICCVFFIVRDFFFIYLFFEGVLIPIIFLILGWGRQPERFEACLYMLVYTVIGSLPLLLCFLWCWGVRIRRYLLLWDNHRVFYGGGFSIFIFRIAFCIKIPLFGVHGWLPKAHVEAPVAGSIILAGLLLKIGVYGLLTIYRVVKIEYIWGFEVLRVIGVLGGVLGGVVCLYQRDIKALIAYSSVSHICFLIVGLRSIGWIGWEGVVLIALSHGVCSPWIFFLANYISEIIETRRVYLLKGVSLGVPILSLVIFLRIRGNIAVPPCVALLAELRLFMSGTFFSVWLVGPLIATCFIAVAYSLNLYTITNHGKINFSAKFKKRISSRCILGRVISGRPLLLGVLVIDIFGLR